MFHVSTLLPHTPNNKQQVRTESPRIWSLLSCCTRKRETNLCVGSRCSGKSLRGGGCSVTNTGHDTVAQMTVLIFFPVWRNNALLLLSTCHFFFVADSSVRSYELCALFNHQLLRKRHIGNDIVTIVFQEPGAHPFTPKAIRSHFQHVFILVRVHDPCSDNTCYRWVWALNQGRSDGNIISWGEKRF